MQPFSFPDLVKHYFDFLVTDYGYSKDEEIDRAYRFEKGRIKYFSDKTILIIELGRHDFEIKIGPIDEPKFARLTPGQINDFLTQNKEISDYSWPKHLEETEIRFEKTLVQDSAILREKCVAILKGDFSWWIDALEFHLMITKEWVRIRSKGKELPIEPLEEYIISKRKAKSST